MATRFPCCWAARYNSDDAQRHSACEKPRAASSGAVDDEPRTFTPAKRLANT